MFSSQRTSTALLAGDLCAMDVCEVCAQTPQFSAIGKKHVCGERHTKSVSIYNDDFISIAFFHVKHAQLR